MQQIKSRPRLVIAFVALIVIITTGGCNKKNDSQLSATCSNGVMDGNEAGIDCGGGCNTCAAGQYRVKRIEPGNGGYMPPTDFYYLPDGRIDSLTIWLPDAYGIKYTYTANQVAEHFKDRESTYTLNSNGYAITRITTDTNGVVQDNQTYSYDAEGHLQNNATADTYVDGNLISSSGTSAVTYTYHMDKLNTLSNENKGQMYLGRESKNLKATATYAGTPPVTYTYSYQYDALKRVTRVEVGGIVTTYTYY